MAVDYKDYYKTLGVKRDATPGEVKAAYRRLARKHHPDVNPGDKAAAARFKEINEANEVLSDKDKRERYDSLGSLWSRMGTQKTDQQSASAPFGAGFPPFDAPAGARTRTTTTDFSDFFHSIFGQAATTRQAAPPRKGEDIEQPIDVSLNEVMAGGQRVFSIRGQQTCGKCLGTGEASGTTCAGCAGTGLVDYSRRIEVKIPAGVRDGQRIRVANEGNPGVNGGERGDLWLVVRVQLHLSFSRDGDNIQTELDVPFTRLILGGEVEATTLTGRILLKIPPHTQNGRVFRISGKGLPQLKGAGHGDLLIKVRAVLPSSVTPRLRELVEEIERVQKADQITGARR